MTSELPVNSRVALVLACSPEGRCRGLLTSVLKQGFKPVTSSVLHFSDYDTALDLTTSLRRRETTEAYRNNSRELERELSQCGVTPNYVATRFDNTDTVAELTSSVDQDSILIVDISCIPRLHLTALVLHLLSWANESQRCICLGYTRAVSYPEAEDAFSVGVTGYSGVPGLAGHIRHRENVAIVIAGFEGNRALSAFRRIAPAAAKVLLGDLKDDELRAIALRNNHQLLSNHRVTHSLCASFDPLVFLLELSRAAADLRRRHPDSNLCVVPLGTKLQTAASVLLVNRWPDVQFLFTNPTARLLNSAQFGDTELFDFQKMIKTSQHL